jgi:hypothetical protein
LRERSITASLHPGLPQGQALGGKANVDREVVVHSNKKLWSRVEAAVDASEDFIK